MTTDQRIMDALSRSIDCFHSVNWVADLKRELDVEGLAIVESDVLAKFEEWLETELARPLNQPRYRAARPGLKTARAALRQIKTRRTASHGA